MHATTLGQLSQQLKSYIQPGQSFASCLNQALQVIYGMGIWRDLTIEGVFDCSNGYVTLPEEAESVLYAVFNNQPARVHSLWHDFQAVGDRYDSTLSFGLVDDGFKPLLVDLTEATSSIYIQTAASSTIPHSYSLSDGNQLTVTGNDGDQFYTGVVVPDLDSENIQIGYKVEFGSPITSILNICYEGFTAKFDLRLDRADRATTIATVGPGDGVCRFRRYRVPQATSNSYVHILCKRQFLPLQKDNEIVYINNFAALKHALLAIVAEDNADLERSEIHWGKCRQILDEQLDQYRGPARPSLNLQMNGEGILATRNLY